MTTELTKAAQQALEALEDARDDVETARQQAAQLIGYPRTDARHASYVAQLEKHDAAIDALRTALTQRHAAQTEREAPYGYCPECSAPGVMRERRPNGDDKCSNGHRYPSRTARASLTAPQQATPASAPQSLLMRLAGIAAECSDPDTTDALDALIAATQQATPEPVGEPAAWRWFNSNGDQVTNWLDFKAAQKAKVEAQVAEAGGRIEYAYTGPAAAPAVPDDTALLDYLDTLATRPAGSDLHCFGGRVVLYVRTGIGSQIEASGAGTAREAIRAAMLAAAQAKGADHG